MNDVTTTCRDIKELSVPAQTACHLFMSECKNAGLNVLITETYRSQERQDYLYAQGRTRAGNVVTWTKSSRHTSRRAWDICKNQKGAEYSDAAFFKACGAIAKDLGITWGGMWKTPDTPHFEVEEDWEETKMEEDEEMTADERKKFNALVEAVEGLTARIDELNIKIKALEQPVYNYIGTGEMPAWIEDLAVWGRDNGIIRGTGAGWGMTQAKAEMLAMVKNAFEKCIK